MEKKLIKQRVKEFQIHEYVLSQLGNAGLSHTEIQRTPLGEKIVIYTSRPGLVVGKKGENIRKLTIDLKKRFDMENPQIEVADIENPNLDARAVSQQIVYALEKFGSKRFKSEGYRALQQIMDAGALGAEIVISGKIPSARAKKWRFYAGYLKKSGDIAESYVRKNTATAKLKSGIVGIKVRILTPDVKLPDKVKIIKEIKEEIIEEPKNEIKKETKPEEVKEAKEEKKQKKENGNNKEKRNKATK